MRNVKTSRLSALEQAVMQVVWDRGTATADEVRAALEPDKPLKDSTIRTTIRRLEEKGYATHTVEGRTYRYAGVEPPQRVAANAVRQIIERFCGGSVEQLLVGMVDNEVLDPAELKRLADKVARHRARTGTEDKP
jgi:BlaI family transcriptional regulator, penicillinase repressor